MLVGSALFDKHETGLACIAQAEPYKMCILHEISKNDHIWPKPMFSGPEPGFGPDEVTFGVNPSKNNQNVRHWPENLGLDVGCFGRDLQPRGPESQSTGKMTRGGEGF